MRKVGMVEVVDLTADRSESDGNDGDLRGGPKLEPFGSGDMSAHLDAFDPFRGIFGRLSWF